MSRSRHNAGFSLIEVMVAVVILAIAVVGLTHGITTALESSKDSEQQTVAALFASGKIEELRAIGPVEDGDTEGDCGTELPAYRWKQSVTAADIDRLHTVTVTVENTRTGEAIYELKTMLFDTGTGSDSADDAKNKKEKKKTKRGGGNE